ncbi:MAG: pyridoxamine 5'-phosphate oxidase family protein [Cyclobacteriaceae bacterium]|nr:pyridoxamine 5'-phosphate oxidase family protein [Cyclobacteriaceae bacterium]
MIDKKIFLVLTLLVFLSINTFAQPSDSVRQHLTSVAREIISRAEHCVFITVDQNRQPQARTMDPFEPEADFTIWLATNPSSRKVKQIRKNSNVTLYYYDGDNGYVSLYGKAELVNNQQEKDKRWKTEWADFYPNRTDAYLLIRVKPSRLEIISYKNNIIGDSKTWKPEVVEFRKP